VLERTTSTRLDLRDFLALAIALLAFAMAYRGLREPSHDGHATVVALLLVARGLVLGRSFRAEHLAWSALLLVLAYAAAHTGHVTWSWCAIAGAGAVAGLPRRPPAPAGAADRRHVWALVDRTGGDALAPFVLRTDKSYVFSGDRQAAVGYRVRCGTAVASGDPVGDPASYRNAVDAFVAHAESNGWRVAVLAASERSLPWWGRHGLRGVPIGRDVVIDVATFDVVGRRFRNLRQAVQRTHNAGVTTEIVAESELTDEVRAELVAVQQVATKGAGERGFAMILDHPLTRTHPGTFVAIARTASGEAVAVQRYASADGGRELSLDVPWRKPGSPNGVDERLIADVVTWAERRGARTVSLAFAAFPELFELEHRNRVQQTVYRAVHLLDRLIKVESLYRFVRKFHALGKQRYVALRPLQVVSVAVAALLLEFGGRRTRRR
jgi:lysylphosphatidylglycerol synthetase-like protein (DUF2156 family)